MPEMTIEEIQRKMAAGELTARALAEHYLRRIAEIDHAGHNLRSVIEVNPDALAIADALDAQRQERGLIGPLHGVPILIKDNIETGDRMLTAAGSLALAYAPAPRDATVAAKLRAAGALILGKTNLSEWANFRSTHSTSGWSSRGGQTKNPYALDRNPCGSSSGSGVAPAADLCAAAVGTETDGSIICPAHANGIVGLKPTLGLISRAGIVPIAHSQDTAGPMGRTVADVAALLSALVGPDPRDAATFGLVQGRQPDGGAGLSQAEHEWRSGGNSPWETLARGENRENQPGTGSAEGPLAGKYYVDYTQFLDRDGLRDARIGVARNFFGHNPHVDRLMEDAINAMREAGAEIVDPAPVQLPKEADDNEMQVLLYEFKADLAAYFAERGPDCPVRSLADVIAFNREHAAEVMPYFGQEIMEQAEAKGPLTDEAYLAALRANLRLARDEGIDHPLRAYSLDAIVAPSGNPARLTDYVTGPCGGGSDCTSPAAIAGYPHITVPAGYVWGLPVGISFFASAFAEPTLLRLAYAFEQLTHLRRPPQFLPGVDLSQGPGTARQEGAPDDQ